LCKHLICATKSAKISSEQVRKILGEFAVDEMSMSTETSSVDLFNFAIKLREEGLFPCLCFQLESFKCLEMLKGLLGTLEERQRTEFPNYYDELVEKAAKAFKDAADQARAKESMAKGKKDKDDDARSEAADMDVVATFIDTAAPHPRFVLTFVLFDSIFIDDLSWTQLCSRPTQCPNFSHRVR
jgi:hypothetical protein